MIMSPEINQPGCELITSFVSSIEKDLGKQSYGL